MPPSVFPALDIAFPSLTAVSQPLEELAAAVLDDWDIHGIEERSSLWRVYFRTAQDRNRAGEALAATFAGDVPVVPVDVLEETDWVARTQAGLRATRVGRLIVAPPWDVPHVRDELRGPRTQSLPLKASRDLVIVVQPSTGFGTAHHHSTRLALEALQRLTLTGRAVLDAGTGSGVLAIAACRLGARDVVALDVDPSAIEAARDSLTRNTGCQDIRLQVADVADADLGSFDVILANLSGTALTRLASRLCALTRPGGYVVTAGFLRDETEAVQKAFNPRAGEYWRAEENDWVAVIWQITPR